MGDGRVHTHMTIIIIIDLNSAGLMLIVCNWNIKYYEWSVICPGMLGGGGVQQEHCGTVNE